MSLCLVWDLEYLEENKMTLEEKLKLITAYHNKEIVERFYEYDGVEVWQPVGLDAWNFELGQYRIKPNSEPKYKVDDVLVDKTEEGRSNPVLYKCTGIGNNWYYFNGKTERTKEFVHNNFIDINEVLWYFEAYDYVAKKYTMHPARMTIPEMDEKFAANHDTLSWKPMYNLGFKLKEN